jgi:DNA ligase (NAD+)
VPSIVKCNNLEDVIKSCKYINDLLVEYKLDGVFINITYVNGKLFSVITKGNRHSGRDVTSEFINYTNIPKTIKDNDVCEVRCEIVMKNQIYKKKYSKHFVDSRSTISGQMNKKHIDSDFLNDVDIYAHNTGILTKYLFTTQEQIYKFLQNSGFNIMKNILVTGLTCIATVQSFIDDLNKQDYLCDGCIIKFNQLDVQIQLMHKNPKLFRYIIAYKKNQILLSTVIYIKYIISKDSTIIPLVGIAPVKCDDKICTVLTMYSYRTLREHMLCVGDQIKIKYNTTFVYDGIDKRNCKNEFIALDKCPFCKTKIICIGNRIFCSNLSCCAKISAIVVAYLRIKNITNIGKTIIDTLIKLKIIKLSIDLFNVNIIKNIEDKLKKCKNFKEKKITNIIN